jgi:Zn-dependent protease
MFRSWRIGSAFGIGIFVHPTFWLLPLMVVMRAVSGGADYVVVSLVLLTAAMGCVVLHELGHALTARYFGIRTRDITLYPIGGVARLERLSDNPIEELLIAIAGPGVNVVIAGGLAVLLLLGQVQFGWEAIQAHGLAFVGWTLFWINVVLVLFNLIPAIPMDGGRVLRALLALPLGRLRATEIAAGVGVVCAIGIGFASFYVGNPMLILIGVVALLGGRQELAMVRHQEAMRQAREAEALTVEPILSDGNGESVRPGFSGFLWDGRIRAWVLWRDGRPVAVYGAGPE